MPKSLKVYMEWGNKGLPEVQQGFERIKNEAKSTGASLKVVNDHTDSLNQKLGQTKTKLQGINQDLATAQRIIATGLITGVGTLLGIMVKGVTTFSEYRIEAQSFGVLLDGNVKLAEKLTAALVRRADATPFEFPELTALTKQLIGAGESLDDIMRKKTGLLDLIGDVKALNQNVSLDQVARTYIGLRQGLIDRVQLGAIGISTEQLMAKGVKFDKSGSLASSGKDAADALLQIFKERFAGGMDKLSQEIPGLMSTLRDKIRGGFRIIGEGIEPEIKEMLKGAIATIDSALGNANFMDSLKNGAKALLDTIKPLISGAGDGIGKLIDYLKQDPMALARAVQDLVAALKFLFEILTAITAARFLISLANGFMTLAETIIFLTGATKGPAGLIAAIVGAAGMVAAFKVMKDKLDELLPTGSQTEGLPGLIFSLGKTTEQSDLAAAATRRLSDEFPELNRRAETLATKLGEIVPLFAELNAQADNTQKFENLGSAMQGKGGPEAQLQVHQGSPQGPLTTIDTSSINEVTAGSTLFDSSGNPLYYYDGLPIGGVYQNTTPGNQISLLEALGRQGGHQQQNKEKLANQKAAIGYQYNPKTGTFDATPTSAAAQKLKPKQRDALMTIYAVGKQRGYSDDDITAAVASALPESGLNPDAVNWKKVGAWPHVGLFQMDMNKGTIAQNKDPEHAANWWFNELDRLRKKGEITEGMPLGEIAWRIEKPEKYNRGMYAKHVERARALLGLTGDSGDGSWPGATPGFIPDAPNEDLQKAIENYAKAKKEFATRSKMPLGDEALKKLTDDFNKELAQAFDAYVLAGGQYNDPSFAQGRAAWEKEFGAGKFNFQIFDGLGSGMPKMDPLVESEIDNDKRRMEDRVKALQAERDAVKDTLEPLKEAAKNLQELKNKLTDIKDNLSVSLQRLFGFDLGADKTQFRILERKLREAHGSYDPSDPQSVTALGEAALKFSEFGASFRTAPGPDGKMSPADAQRNQIANAVQSVLQELGISDAKGNIGGPYAQALDQAQMSVQEKLDTTNVELGHQTSYLAAIEAHLAKLAGQAALPNSAAPTFKGGFGFFGANIRAARGGGGGGGTRLSPQDGGFAADMQSRGNVYVGNGSWMDAEFAAATGRTVVPYEGEDPASACPGGT